MVFLFIYFLMEYLKENNFSFSEIQVSFCCCCCLELCFFMPFVKSLPNSSSQNFSTLFSCINFTSYAITFGSIVCSLGSILCITRLHFGDNTVYFREPKLYSLTLTALLKEIISNISNRRDFFNHFVLANTRLWPDHGLINSVKCIWKSDRPSTQNLNVEWMYKQKMRIFFWHLVLNVGWILSAWYKPGSSVVIGL